MTTPSSLPLLPPLTPVAVCKGVICLAALGFTATLGSVFMLGPILPLMAIQPQLFRWVTDWMMNLWLLLPVALMELFMGVTIVTSGDSLQSDEGSIILMNHRTRLDWMFFWVVLHRQSTLRTEKIILKNDPKITPGFGWAMQVACYIFLKRRWETDKPWLLSLLEYFGLLQYKGQFLIFPEGTNFDAKTKLSSDRFAEKNSLPKYRYCLHPRTTGLVFLTQELRRKNLLDTVYDVTVTYPDIIPEHGELNLVLGNLPSRVNFHIRRLPPASLPTSKEDLESWCLQRWQTKEDALRSFYTSNKDCFIFPGDEGDGSEVHTQESDKWTLCLALTYWIAFLVAAFTLLWFSVIARWYFLVITGFFFYQLVVRGGVETSIMEWCRWFYRQKDRRF